MSDHPDDNLDGTAGRVRPLESFTRNCQALWATTYGLDLALVNEFLLAQLGDPPINLTVMADATRLADTLERTRDTAALTAVNRRWLLRGVQYGTGAFHPKTYLAVTPTKATLLIGSGNLNADGLGAGKEVFTRFTTGSPVGDAAVATWAQWARRLVTDAGDLRLAERFTDLSDRLPTSAWPLDTITADPDVAVLHNLDRPLLDQLLDHLPGGGVDELLLAAPFYDPDAAAAAALVDALGPARVQVWAAADTKVDGPLLLERLAGRGAQVTVWRYTPERLVHAKLVGVITGEQGWLLSGSANLSRAGLSRTPAAGGNVELAVLTRLPAAAAHSTYRPPDTSVEPWPQSQLDALTFRPDPHPAPLPVRLHTAERTTDSRIRLRTTPAPDPLWLLTDGAHREPVAPAAGPEAADCDWPHSGRLVWLCRDNGDSLSNRVVVDEPQALLAALRSGDDAASRDRPAELSTSDVDTPLGRLLEGFHRHLIMDAAEQDQRSTAADATEEEGEAGKADELWERLQREQLIRDPRAGRYRGFRTSETTSGEFLLELLETLRERAPASDQPAPSAFQATVTYLNELAEQWHRDHADDHTEETRPTRRWPLATRVRVRARNVLRRWAHAQSEPRLVWIDPLAPVKNLECAITLLAGLHDLRRQDAQKPERPPACPLTSEDLADLAYRWIAAIVGTGEGDGWFATADDDTREQAHHFVDDHLAGVCAALAWQALEPGPSRRERLIRWQPVVRRATDYHLMAANPHSTEVVHQMTATWLPVEKVTERLEQCRDFIDDPLWCERTASSLSLERLALDDPPGGVAAPFGATLHVDGIHDPLVDPRTVRLIAAVRAYRAKPGVALYAWDRTWRLAVPHNDTAAFMAARDGPMLSSEEPIDDALVELLLDDVGVLAPWFVEEQVA